MSRRVVSIAGGACVVLLLAWVALLWSPKGGELDVARKRQAAAENLSAELQAKLARLQGAQRQAPQLQADLEQVRAAIPSRADLAEFILSADDAASKAGVDFLSITPTPPAVSQTPGAPNDVALNLALKGSYFPVLDFLQKLLDLPRLVVVDGVTVAPDGDPSVLNVGLKARMFTTAQPPGTAPTTPTTTGAAK